MSSRDITISDPFIALSLEYRQISSTPYFCPNIFGSVMFCSLLVYLSISFRIILSNMQWWSKISLCHIFCCTLWLYSRPFFGDVIYQIQWWCHTTIYRETISSNLPYRATRRCDIAAFGISRCCIVPEKPRLAATLSECPFTRSRETKMLGKIVVWRLSFFFTRQKW